MDNAEEVAANESVLYENANKWHRLETRNQTKIGVMVASLDGRLSTEATFTENISRHGVRIVARQRWRVDDTVLVKSLEGNFQ